MSADRLDSLDMLGATLSLPDQLRSALARSQPSVAVAGEFHHVLVCGMGGSGIGGDLAAAITSGTLPVPLLVSKQYELPGYIGNRSLVIASSFSGNSEETVGAARAADEAGATVVVMSSGGKLAEFAAERGCAYYEIDPAIAMPRAGIGAMTVPLLALFEDLGWADSMREQVAATAQHLDGRIEEFRGHDGAPARLARAIGRTIPLVYGAGVGGEAVALRWKGQFNENPKVPSWSNRVPELMHNEVCGWAQHGDVTRQMLSLVVLHSDYDHPQNRRRFELMEQVCAEVLAGIHHVHAQGSTLMEQLFDLIVFGDLLTLEAAFEAGVDPGPVPILNDIKAELARTTL